MKKIDMKNFDCEEFDIEYDNALKILIIIAFIFFFTFFIVTVGDLLFDWQIGTNADWGVAIFFGLFALLCLTAVGGVVIWKIRIDHDDLYYRSMIGITKHYKASDISKVVWKESKILGIQMKLYDANDKKITTIDDNLYQGAYFIVWCEHHHIEMIDKKSL